MSSLFRKFDTSNLPDKILSCRKLFEATTHEGHDLGSLTDVIHIACRKCMLASFLIRLSWVILLFLPLSLFVLFFSPAGPLAHTRHPPPTSSFSPSLTTNSQDKSEPQRKHTHRLQLFNPSLQGMRGRGAQGSNGGMEKKEKNETVLLKKKRIEE